MNVWRGCRLGQCGLAVLQGSCAVLLVGCASAPESPRAPRLDRPLLEQLRAAEKLYRDKDDSFAAERDRLAADPAAAYWLTRMFVVDLVRQVDARKADETTFLQTVRDKNDSVLAGEPLDQLKALGGAAVPAIADDLLASSYTDRRRLGADLLIEMGPVVVGPLEHVLEGADWSLRRLVYEVVGGLPASPEGTAVLRRGLGDEHFAVRAVAVHGLALQGDSQAATLRSVLASDGDSYVRRVAAQELAAFGSRDTAAALIDYMAEALAAGDRDGVRAADRSLQQVSGREKGGDLSFWRAWLSSRPSGEKQ